MATAPTQLEQTRRRAREVGGDLRERFESLEPLVRDRWDELEPVLRERWSELEPVMRERWSEVEPVVRERWNELEPVVRQRLDDLEPAVRQAQLGLWRALRALFGALVVLPAMLVRALKAVAGVADDAAERGQQLGEEALKRRRRRGVTLRRRTLVAYVAGGVGVGFAVGWLLGRQRAEDEWLTDDELPFEASGPAGNGAPRGDASLVE